MLHALRHTRAEYVCLADQDDIWLDNKASLFCQQMLDTAKPHLIFSDAWVWYPGRDPAITLWNADGLKPENTHDTRKLAFHNAVQGASTCINRALVQSLKADRKSTRLNSSHVAISYAVFCLKKKNTRKQA